MQYLQETKKAFFTASLMSISKGSSPEEAELLSKLRIALTEAYLSIMHGLYDLDCPQMQTEDKRRQIEEFAVQMFQYIEGLVGQQDLEFPPTLLKPMYDLFLDMTAIWISDQPANRMPDSHICYN